MGARTNTRNRLPLRQAISSIEVFEEADFGIASGGIITLSGFKQFVLKDTVTMSNRFEIADGASIEILGASFLTQQLIYTGSGTFFSNAGTAGIGRFYVQDISFQFNNVSSTAFDLKGTGAPTSEVNVDFIDLIWMTAGGTLGVFENFSLIVMGLILAIDFKGGLTFKNNDTTDLTRSIFFPSTPVSTDAIFNVIGPRTRSIDFTGSSLNPADSGDSGLFIEPTILGTGGGFINDFIVFGGPYFKAGSTGTITAFADASITATAITTVSSGTSIPGGGNYARFNHSGTDVFVGQRVVTSTFTPEVTYNQTLIVTVTGAGFLEGDIESTGAPIPFTNDDAGSYLSNSVTVTSAGHAQSNDQSLLITLTLDYNGGFSIYNVQTDTFQINAIFDTAETSGNWDTGSLTEKDNRIDVKNSGQQKSSIVAGGWDLSGNVTATTVASGVFNDIAFNGSTVLSYNERVTLINSLNGTCRYDGINPAVLSIPVEFYIIPNSGADREYDIKLVRSTDGGSTFDNLTDVIVTRVNIKGTNTLFSTRRTVLLNNGDQYKWVQSGVSTTNGFTASQGCSTI